MHVFGKGDQTKLLKGRTGMQDFVFNVVQVRVAVHVRQRNWLENDREVQIWCFYLRDKFMVWRIRKQDQVFALFRANNQTKDS